MVNRLFFVCLLLKCMYLPSPDLVNVFTFVDGFHYQKTGSAFAAWLIFTIINRAWLGWSWFNPLLFQIDNIRALDPMGECL